MILSILIAASKTTRKDLDNLLSVLLPQIKPDLEGKVEIYIEAENLASIGWKCNSLLKDAIGKYIWFLNDTDLISDTAVSDILQAAEHDVDIVSISGAVWKNGQPSHDWECRLPNFCWNSPMKRSLVESFRNRKLGAIKEWMKVMTNPYVPFSTEYVVESPMVRNNINDI